MIGILGKQQCVDGTDEDNCEQLMFNECDPETDYRCRNGMCIDQEYFLDGDQGDCLDLSDEQYHTPYRFGRCTYQPDMICDERMPRAKLHFVCGDGEVLPEDAILQRDKYKASCESYRDKNYMCELDDYLTMWTDERNGHCLDWGFEEEIIDCNFMLKCAITKGRHRLCNCSANDCLEFMKLNCPQEILFPAGRIYAPFVENYYVSETLNFEKSRLPNYYSFTHSIKCDGFQARPNNISNIAHTDVMKLLRDTWMPWNLIYCQRSDRNESGFRYDKQCWNASYPNRAYHCPRAPYECISMDVVKDGWYDCLEGL